ncbi:biological adhesion [Homalodisca vitripennis]|nr:biological adhesion [Homalodisca vitripennis]
MEWRTAITVNGQWAIVVELLDHLTDLAQSVSFTSVIRSINSLAFPLERVIGYRDPLELKESSSNHLSPPTSLWSVSLPHKYIWHGSQVTGERAMDLYCDAWDSDSPDRTGLASPLLQQRLLGQERLPCDYPLAVLCVEVNSSTFLSRRRRARTDSERLPSTAEVRGGNVQDYSMLRANVELVNLELNVSKAVIRCEFGTFLIKGAAFRSNNFLNTSKAVVPRP